MSNCASLAAVRDKIYEAYLPYNCPRDSDKKLIFFLGASMSDMLKSSVLNTENALDILASVFHSQDRTASGSVCH